jgi:parallel beta-helix repeat protein
MGADSATTVIDGEEGCLLYCVDVLEFSLSGITFRNGSAGGGALSFRRSHPTLTLCGIVRNTGGQSGGSGQAAGIVFDDHSEASITRCTVAGNFGSGIRFSEGSSGLIEGNLIVGNYGGGIEIRGSNPVVRGNRIVGDPAVGGRGIESFESNVMIANNRIDHHRGGGIGLFGGISNVFGNEITDNSGPGVFSQTSFAVIDSNLIARNRVTGPNAQGAGL